MKTKFLILFALLFTACVTDRKTYYFDAGGEGYVYYGDTKLPATNATVCVHSGFASHGWATNLPIEEMYYTNSSGYYHVKFIKKTDGENTVYITVTASDLKNGYNGSNWVNIYIDLLKKQKQTIQIDTIWIHK